VGEVKKYGEPPYSIVLLHGGPGASGEMAPVARQLSEKFPILEPYQTEPSVLRQVEELKNQLDGTASYPVILAGYSWGEWLAWIFAARYPKLVKKIILISSGPFEASYAPQIMKTRVSRLNNAERQEVEFLTNNIGNPAVRDKFKLFKRLGDITSHADLYDPDYNLAAKTFLTPEIYENVWKEADAMRASGELLKLSKRVKCHVTAIHGDYDPHPAEGVRKPLSKVKRMFRFVLLKNCGHTPWIEKQAMNGFYKVMEAEFSAI